MLSLCFLFIFSFLPQLQPSEQLRQQRQLLQHAYKVRTGKISGAQETGNKEHKQEGVGIQGVARKEFYPAIQGVEEPGHRVMEAPVAELLRAQVGTSVLVFYKV